MEESQAQTKIAHGARISHPHCDGDRCYLVVSLVHIMRGPCPKERTLIYVLSYVWNRTLSCLVLTFVSFHLAKARGAIKMQ